MAKRFKLRELEKEYGNLHELIPPLVNQCGQNETGRKLGISQYTVSTWLKDNGYIAKLIYVRTEAQEQAS